jgi:hypothetical protein
MVLHLPVMRVTGSIHTLTLSVVNYTYACYTFQSVLHGTTHLYVFPTN